MLKLQEQIDRLIKVISTLVHINESEIAHYVHGTKKDSKQLKKITNVHNKELEI